MIKNTYLVHLKKLNVVCILFCAFYWSVSAQSIPLFDQTSFKLELLETGVHKLDYNWIVENIGSNSNPQDWQLWSNSPDYIEIPLSIIGIEDGSFDQSDYVLFYWDHSEYQYNPFDNRSFVFLVTNEPGGKRVNRKELADIQDDNINRNQHIHIIYNELIFNLLHEDLPNTGSGQLWVADEISNNKQVDLIDLLALSKNDLIERIEVTVIVRSDETENLSLTFNDLTKSATVRSVELGDVEDEFGRTSTLSFSHQELVGHNNILSNLDLTFIKTSDQARAWIDEINIVIKDEMKFEGAQTFLNPIIDEASNVVAVNTDTEAINIWEINPNHEIQALAFSIQNNEAIFNLADSSNGYVVFDPALSLLTPLSVEEVDIFQLDQVTVPDFLILYHKNFESEALRLKAHRETFSGLSVAAIEDERVYNEFAGGRKTPEAIRLFAKSLYDRNQRFKFLLLIGDGSFDYNHIYEELPDQNLIPTFETEESLDPLEAFPTDDYFALLDESEPEGLRGTLDIAVGRLPVNTAAEAEAVITKIINYDLNKETIGNWRNNIAFLADDEDFNLHIDDADEIANKVEDNHKAFIKNKVYWDAYPQVSTPGGNRYPDANNDLNQAIDQGLLVMNYLGHGGSIGWSQERVLNTTDIESWTNFNKLPLIITATCSFTGFDDPTLSSAGELALLNPVGGGVALFTTVRSVYASKNFRLTSAVFDILFTKENGQHLPIGEILRRAKNNTTTRDINARKFLLIGDPSMTLAYPREQVQLTLFNGGEVTQDFIDSIGALDLIQFSGIVTTDGSTPLTQFNGLVDITIYDKPSKIQTLQNDSRSLTKTFDLRKNILYKGTVEVSNGVFDGNFIIPVDIDYSLGKGKISLYARSDDGIDGSGYFDQFVIAGTSDTPIIDNTGPKIDLYLDDRTFNSGDLTSSRPLLIADLSDESGINLSQVSIGHEITVIIDDNSQNTIILNDLFNSNSSSNTSAGTIEYQIEDLTPGVHQLELRAFDIANNLSTAQIEFVVDQSLDDQIMGLGINPTLSSGEEINISIAHNINEIEQVLLEFFDMSGQKINQQLIKGPFNTSKIEASLNLSDQNTIITNGVYLCRAKINVATGEEILSDLKRLVILK